MRYPVGERRTLAEAMEAAREAATMTNMRYKVEQQYVYPSPYWTFRPCDTPDITRHEPVRV